MNIKHMILLLQSKKKLTQSEIAEAIGCRQSNISNLLRAHGASRPSSKVVDGLRQLMAEHGLTE